MTNSDGLTRGMTLRDWVYIAILLFSAGGAVFSFATKTELQNGLNEARKERMETISKTFDEHKVDQRADMDRLWRKLDDMDRKIDRLKR